MTRTFIAAATLLLGTSALTGAAAQDKYDKPLPLVSSAKISTAPAQHKMLATKSVQTSALKKGMTHSGMGGPLEKEGTASFAGKPAMIKAAKGGSMLLADNEKIVGIKSAKASTGMGGPFEDGLAGADDLTPRPAADNYPPCRPGPGDDRCIQLYEPGVRAELASWNRETGGLADGSAVTAMGGPYEPVEASWKDEAHGLADGKTTAMGGPFEPAEAMADAGGLAMNGDGVLDGALGETSDPADDVVLAGHSEFAGVGGPIESQSGYPPCSPGAGDDRCIQLYEPGVTGAGN